MGHNYLARNRPIVGETPAGVGATYIVVEGYEDDVNIQCTVVGTVTYTVDWTNQNILYDAAAIKAVNVAQVSDPERYVDPASADWVNAQASGAVTADTQLGFPVFALRINITAGTGSVRYHITQA
jgi:hypothetical protein